VSDDREGAAGHGWGTGGRADQDLDSLLAQWAEQSGPWRRSPTRDGGRHAAPDAPTFR